MKKIVSFLLISVMTALLCGCSAVKETDTDRVRIITTMFAAYDFAREAAGEKADIKMLLKPGAEAHSYEPTPKDVMEIEECDIFICVGGENDAWVEKILSSAKNPDMIVIRMLDMVEKYEEEIVEGMEAEDEHEDGHDDHKDWDEHVWTNPGNAAIITKGICDALIKTDAKNTAAYEDNYASYEKKLKELDESFKNLIDNAERKELIFGDRYPLRYFSEAYGLKYYAAFPGCASETEPSSKTIAFLINKVKEDKIPVVFTIELSNKKIAEAIAKDTGAKVLTFYSCHNVSRDDFDNGESYLSLMKKNLETLKEALN